jgi:hypothetical protein
MSNDIVRLSEYNPKTPIQIRVGDQTIELSVESALECCVPPEAKPVDVLKYLLFCRANSLDPLMGDVTLVPRDGRHIPVVLKAGWMRRLMDSPLYESHEAGILVKDSDGNLVEVVGTCALPEQLVMGGWARIKLKGRPAFFHSVQLSEYSTGMSTWKSIPRTMIRKVALVQGCREVILLYLGGYDQSEVMTPEVGAQAARVEVSPTIEAEYEEVVAPNLSPGLLTALHIQIDRLKATQEEVAAWCRSRKVNSLAEMSDTEGSALIAKLEGIPDPDNGDVLPDSWNTGEPYLDRMKESVLVGHPIVVEAVQDEGPAEPGETVAEQAAPPAGAATLDRYAIEDRLWPKALELGMGEDNWYRLLRQFEGMNQDAPSHAKLTVPQLIAFDCFLDDQARRKANDPNWPGVPDSISGLYLIPPATRPVPEPKKRGRPKKAETTA